jgi:7,8-dihydropterin-6-yl-methyl-4-(beta-D-ribofuranosyl)aminobenzene 5'-phosphate synthase
MTIVYDNNPFDEKLERDWGFSCFIKGLEKSILFDTGTNGRSLLSNMEKLGILPEEIDLVFLSHALNSSLQASRTPSEQRERES